MKTLFFSLFFCMTAFFSSLCAAEKCKDSRIPAPYIVAKAGYFFFADAEMRKVYSNGGIDLQLSGAYPVYPYLSVYGSVEFLQKSGRSLQGNQRTSIWEVPLSAGLQTSFLMYSPVPIYYYITLGPRYVFAQVHNHSPYVPHHMNQNGFGGFANTGFLFNLWHGLTLDLFGEYSYCRLHFHSSKTATRGHSVQVGGFAFGGGLGYSF